MRYAIRLTILIACSLMALLPAQAQRRVALVVGNAAYKLGPLANPVNDAEAVAEALEQQLKFDTVLLRRDLGAEAFRAALRELAREARGAEVGLVFFAGHGIETAGHNYLVPTDASLGDAADIELEAIRLETVLSQLSGVTKLRLVILDACRNNPFPAAERSYRGLVSVQPDLGTLIAYAAKDGTLAADGKGRHSPYTAALLKRIAAPALDVRRLFGYVRTDVTAATGGKQVPWLYGDLGGDEIHLNPPASFAPAPKLPIPPLPPLTGPSPAEVAQFCQSVAANSSLAVLRSMLNANRGTTLAPCIEARLKELTPKSLPPPETLAPRPLTATEERALRSKDSFKECEACPEMVVVPVGSFAMGSPLGEADRESDEGPQQWVAIPRPFAMGKFEVTRGEFAAFLQDTRRSVGDRCYVGQIERRELHERAGRSFYDPGFPQDDRHPAVCVSWGDATAFAGWLSRRTGKAYRLPTEAEWEYAARAGTTTRYAFGNTINTYLAQYSGAVWGSAGGTAAARSFGPNAFGLYDTHGNVWEWVQDCWHASYDGRLADGSARTTGDCDLRVVRGGGWISHPQDLRSANRFKYAPANRYSILGFRLARTL